MGNKLDTHTMNHDPKGDGHVKIVFELTQDAHGWPPVSAETMWALKVNDDRYKIDNIPFYVRGVSCNDIVSAQDRDGRLFFIKVEKDSGHRTVRVIITNNDKVVEKDVREHLKVIGAEIEGVQKGFFALDIPPSADFKEIQTYLSEKHDGQELDYDEGKV
jgi:hypothetical protein